VADGCPFSGGGEMKTGEMYNTALANPEAIFLRKSDGHKYRFTERGYLNCDDSRHFAVPKPNEEWELVREPVDFMTAINSGKIIRSEYWNNGEKFDPGNREALVAITTKCFFGKWFIEN
jgi:hypothetical protein